MPCRGQRLVRLLGHRQAGASDREFWAGALEHADLPGRGPDFRIAAERVARVAAAQPARRWFPPGHGTAYGHTMEVWP